MNLLALVGGGRPGQSTDTLVDRTIEGAQSALPDCNVTKVNLLECDIGCIEGFATRPPR